MMLYLKHVMFSKQIGNEKTIRCNNVITTNYSVKRKVSKLYT